MVHEKEWGILLTFAIFFCIFNLQQLHKDLEIRTHQLAQASFKGEHKLYIPVFGRQYVTAWQSFTSFLLLLKLLWPLMYSLYLLLFNINDDNYHHIV